MSEETDAFTLTAASFVKQTMSVNIQDSMSADVAEDGCVPAGTCAVISPSVTFVEQPVLGKIQDAMSSDFAGDRCLSEGTFAVTLTIAICTTQCPSI